MENKESLFNRLKNYNPFKSKEVVPLVQQTPKNPKIDIPAGRRSQADDSTNLLEFAKNQTKILTPDFMFDVIPYIRKLAKVNPDLGQALNNVVTLGNTGHKIKFDPSVEASEVDKMRLHLEVAGRKWGENLGGMDGVVNRLLAQAMIGGAISVESVPAFNLKTIDRIIFINPETIRFARDQRTDRYKPFQKPETLKYDVGNFEQYVELNPLTFKYLPLNGDTDIPYGTPPYLKAMESIKTQGFMLDNISYIVEEVGVLGFLQVLLDKPEQESNENDATYKGRLENMLMLARDRVKQGLRDGVNVGYKEDVEYQFHSATTQTQGVQNLFQENELQVASGLNQDAVLLGRGYSTSETQITVVFNKMLAELKNSQNIVKEFLEFVYALELRLAGYNFNYLKVAFKTSTLQDELKMQQGQEIKIRNVKEKMILGLINQEQAADEFDIEEPAFPEPRVPWEVIAGGSVANTIDNAASKKKREDGKNKSDKAVRDKNKPGGAKK